MQIDKALGFNCNHWIKGMITKWGRYTEMYITHQSTLWMIDVKELYCRIHWLLRVFKEKTEHNKKII